MTRYPRQELFAPIGPEGQAKLRAARVLVVGCGALGSALAETMVRAGVGRLTVVDRDVVEPSNLHRQFLLLFQQGHHLFDHRQHAAVAQYADVGRGGASQQGREQLSGHVSLGSRQNAVVARVRRL